MATKRRKGSAAMNGKSAGDQAMMDAYHAELWKMADALRGSVDAAEYKHVVLGLLFLKYISDAFEEHREVLKRQITDGADPEDPDEYRGENIFGFLARHAGNVSV